MVFTGKISYSLYLWHWPIFVLMRYVSIEPTLYTQILAIGLTYILSVLSWKYIEQPFRYVKIKSNPQTIIIMYIVPAAILIAIAYIGIINKGYPNRYPLSILKMDNALNSYSSEARKGCHSSLRNSFVLPSDECMFGELKLLKNKENVDIFVIGDSHANHLVPFIDVLAIDAGLSAQDYTLDQCPPIFELNWGSNLYKAEKCKNRNSLSMKHIKNNEFSYVVLSASWPTDILTKKIFTNRRVENNIEKYNLLKDKLDYTLQMIIDSGATPIIIEDTPTLSGKSPKCPIKKEIFNQELNCIIKSSPNLFFRDITNNLSNKYSQLIIINSQKLFCNLGTCEISLNNIPLYRDNDHLNEIGARYLGEFFLKNHNNPFN